jgi:hypothetical protein
MLIPMESQETNPPEDAAPGDEAPAGEPAAGENVCRECNGTGKLNGRNCPNCFGSGTVIEAAGGG